MTTIDSRLKNAGIIAIPIAKELTDNLGVISPNWFVIDMQKGIKQMPFENILTGIIETTICTEISYKIVHREILPENNFFGEEYIERELLPTSFLDITFTIFNVLLSHKSILDNIELVDLALSKFKFRGVLSNLILKVDRTLIENLIVD